MAKNDVSYVNLLLEKRKFGNIIKNEWEGSDGFFQKFYANEFRHYSSELS